MAFDPVTDMDKDIDRTVVEARKALGEITRLQAPHPLGTTKVSRENVKYDFDNREADYWGGQFDGALQRAVTEGENIGWAWIEVLKHDADLRDD